MADKVKVTGIAGIVRNEDNLYDGDLAHYFRALFFYAQNLRHPYHNFRHMLHVFWLCYHACLFYRDDGRPLTGREIRNLLIAALFHDFDHSGFMGNDDLNIERAVRGLRTFILPEDWPYLAEIVSLIHATEYPHKTPSSALDLPAQILRDADVSQALSVAWLQQIVIGLATERGKPPLEVLNGQRGFHENIKFETDWARHAFPPSLLKEKIAEAQTLVDILEQEAN